MISIDNEIRMYIYRTLVATGKAPRSKEIAEFLKEPLPDIKASLSRLHEGHIIVLQPVGHPDEGEVAFAQPFSNMKTGFKVRTKSGEWNAPCIWDSFGIAAALHEEAEIQTSCPDCGENIVIKDTLQLPDDQQHVVHFVLPVRQWWKNVFHT